MTTDARGEKGLLLMVTLSVAISFIVMCVAFVVARTAPQPLLSEYEMTITHLEEMQSR